MFDKMRDMAQKMQMMQKLMKDENFKAFMTHPKIQELLKDPDFQELVKNGNMDRIASHPKFSAFRNDPGLAALVMKLNLKDIQGMAGNS